MSPRRKLPPIVADSDLIEAARIQADRICAQLREDALARALWADEPARWQHWIDSSGGIFSERLI